VYGGLFNTFLSSFHAMDSIPNPKAAEIEPFLAVFEHTRNSGLLERFGFDLDINARLAEMEAQLRQMALRWYGLKLQELQRRSASPARDGRTGEDGETVGQTVP
jgi:hypothetical protein